MPCCPFAVFIGPLNPGGPNITLAYTGARLLPAGYCAGWPAFFSVLDQEGVEAGEQRLRQELSDDVAARIVADYHIALPFRDRYHSDGHATEEDGLACFQSYVRDQYQGLAAEQRQSTAPVDEGLPG